MTPNPRTAFFDGIANQWDGWEDLAVLGRKLARGLDELGVGPDETVLDVGCGTGNLTQALLARMSAAGRVIAVDISARMIELARAKVADARVAWHEADARCLPLADGCCDRVICYSVWPHLDEPVAVARELRRVLRPGGHLHVWHLIARHKVNEIHAAAGQAVRHDVLAPAPQTATVLATAGLHVGTVVDTEARYLVTAGNPEA